jgi:hypothetical protein
LPKTKVNRSSFAPAATLMLTKRSDGRTPVCGNAGHAAAEGPTLADAGLVADALAWALAGALDAGVVGDAPAAPVPPGLALGAVVPQPATTKSSTMANERRVATIKMSSAGSGR